MIRPPSEFAPSLSLESLSEASHVAMLIGVEYPKVSRVPSLPPARPFRVAPPRSNRGGPVQRSVARITGQEECGSIPIAEVWLVVNKMQRSTLPLHSHQSYISIFRLHFRRKNSIGEFHRRNICYAVV